MATVTESTNTAVQIVTAILGDERELAAALAIGHTDKTVLALELANFVAALAHYTAELSPTVDTPQEVWQVISLALAKFPDDLPWKDQ